MKILVDKNIPKITFEFLLETGHDVQDIRGTVLEGVDDEFIWRLTQKEKKLLIITDKGFSQYRNAKHSGILIIRLKQPNRFKIHNRVVQAMKQFSDVEWKNLTVVMRDSVQSISNSSV